MDAIDSDTGRIVVTGGGAELNGIAELFEEYLGIPVRLGLPIG